MNTTTSTSISMGVLWRTKISGGSRKRCAWRWATKLSSARSLKTSTQQSSSAPCVQSSPIASTMRCGSSGPKASGVASQNQSGMTCASQRSGMATTVTGPTATSQGNPRQGLRGQKSGHYLVALGRNLARLGSGWGQILGTRTIPAGN